jgi:pimeloyl-ACP methyl ester carboxylesterase
MFAQAPLLAVSKDGTPIACSKTGSGPAMLLLHGAAANGFEWMAVRPGLSEHFTVYVMERRGRAPSGDHPSYSIERETEDMAALLGSIGELVILVGHSYGALVAVQGMAAGELSNVSRVILYEPPIFAGRNPNHTPALRQVKQAANAGDRDLVTELFLATVFNPERARAIRSTMAWPGLISTANTIPREMETAGAFEDRTVEIEAGLRKWAIPVTMLLGSESPAHIKDGTAFICGSLPDCRTVTLDGQGHVANIQAPALFVEKILEATL